MDTPFEPFKREEWRRDIGEQPLVQFTSATPIEKMTPEEVLAVITGLFASEQMLGPGAVHAALVDGSLCSYLHHLEEVGASAR